jgi:hypothetical protein
MGEKERMEIATREASSALHEIAGRHGLKAEDLSSRFTGSTPAAPKAETPKPPVTTPEETTPATPATPDTPKSEIEKEINTKQEGPKLPPVQTQDEDLFK